MKIFVYSYREDEEEFFEQFNKHYGFDLSFTRDNLNENSVYLSKGYEAVNIAAVGKISASIIRDLKDNGVKYIVSRAAGVNHLDIEAIRQNGLKAANVPSYSPNAISEHTLTLALSLMRHLKASQERVSRQDFTLKGLRGREIRNMTVGIVGTGRIGFETIKAFKALGATVLAYDKYPQDKVRDYASYVALDELYEKSDIVSFHCPSTPENYHILKEETIKKMKDGVYILNTARGELFDYKDVLKGIKSGKIGALGFDVYENEEIFLRQDLKGEAPKDKIFNELITMDNVIFTPHLSFYTDEAVSNMVEISLENLQEFSATGSCHNELVL